MTDELTPLSKKHQVVLDNYLILFHQTKAYMAAYPHATEMSARTAAARLFADDNFSKHLQARLSEVHMSADEALKLTADIARGDVASLMEITSVGGILDLKKAQELGLTKLIKKFKQRTTTRMSKTDEGEDTETHDIEIELYNTQDALRDILKIHGKFIERTDITSGNKPLEQKDNNAGFERAITTLADALREIIPAKGSGQVGEVDTAK